MEQPNQNSNMDEEYEQEQIQHILLKESEKKRIEMERELKESQQQEYEVGLQEDMRNMRNMSVSPIDKIFNEPSIEEMRRIRLIRFGGYKLIKD